MEDRQDGHHCLVVIRHEMAVRKESLSCFRLMAKRNGDAEACTSDGTVDLQGNPVSRDRTGGWKACYFFLGNEVAERIASFGIGLNLLSFMTGVLHQGLVTSVTSIHNWLGTLMLMPLLGAFIADAYLGRYRTIAVFTTIHLMGSFLLTLAASFPSMTPPRCTSADVKCTPASKGQLAFFYISLYLLALGTGGIKPCVSVFGADQFDDENNKEVKAKRAFWNWWFLGIAVSLLVSTTVIVYIQDNVGWGWGYFIPFLFMLVATVCFFAGTPYYRHFPPTGSPLTEFAQIIVAAIRKRNVQVPADPDLLYETSDRTYLFPGRRLLRHTNKFRFLDRAAVIEPDVDPGYLLRPSSLGSKTSPWELSTVSQIEELKLMLGMFPIWATNIITHTLLGQTHTFFLKQGTTMDSRLGPSFKIPPASFAAFASVAMICTVVGYQFLVVPLARKLTGNPTGLTVLQRMGMGVLFGTLSMATAALVEAKRMDVAAEHGLLDKPRETVPMTIFWLCPQYLLGGIAESLNVTALMEFFYEESPDHMRSLGSAVYSSIMGTASFLSSAFLNIIVSVTSKNNGHPWITDNLNRSQLARFYWLLVVTSSFNTLLFILVSLRYTYKKPESRFAHDPKESAIELHSS